MQGTHLWVLALFIVVASCLESRIELQTPTYSTGSELNLEWRLVHSTEQTIEFLRWGTPLEENWNANYFEIVHVETGSKATYAGRIVKRATPSAQHYTKLSGVHQGTLNLASGYRFYSEGTYSITLAFTGVSKDGSVIMVRSNTVEVLVENPDIREQTHRQERDIAFVGCSASEQSILFAAETNAQMGVDSLNLYMSQSLPPACSAEYVQWFGTYSDSNWDIIKNDFIAMIQLFRADAIIFDCAQCLTHPDIDYDGTYAYVYPSDSTHTIYLCALFWSAPPGPYETDCQAGVIVHEASHFDDIAATDDNAYGQSLCMDLAIDDPDAAVNNADSHEYMMEGHPVCSVVGATSCGNGVCDFVETAVTCPEDCDGGAGGDPHLFSFDGEEIKLELPFQDGKFYSFFSSPIMQIVIRTTEREGAVLIDGIGIKIHQNQFLAILNADQDPEVYMNGNLVVHSTTTPFGMLEMFLPHPSDLVGPLAQFSRYVVSGIRIEDFFTVVAGYHPGFGGFFNLAVHQSHASSTGLLPTISRNQNLRDVTLDEFETSTFF